MTRARAGTLPRSWEMIRAGHLARETMEPPDEGPDYLARNRLWQPLALAERLAAAHVVMGGMGGLGWLIGGALVGLGVKRFSVFDPDTLERANLNRLWGCGVGDLGRPKVELFRERAQSIDAGIQVAAFVAAVPCREFEEAVASADIVFGGFDRPEPRVSTQVLAKMYDRPYLDTGVAFAESSGARTAFGQVFFSAGRKPPCILCAGLTLGSPGYMRAGGGGPAPSSGVLNGVLANLAVSLWLDLLGGAGVSALTRFSWHDMAITREPLAPERSCPLCTAPALGPGFLELSSDVLNPEP